MSSSFNRIPTSYPKVSNRQRMREAKAAVEISQTELGKAMFLLLSALGQAGGEIKVMHGTMQQVRLDTMGYEVVDGSLPNEKIIRLVTNGEDNAYLNDDNDGDENGGVEAAVETETLNRASGLCGPEIAIEGYPGSAGHTQEGDWSFTGRDGRDLPITGGF